MELQYGMQAQPTSGTIPQLVQLLQQAALATEADGRYDLARALRWWAGWLESLEENEGACASELWYG